MAVLEELKLVALEWELAEAEEEEKQEPIRAVEAEDEAEVADVEEALLDLKVGHLNLDQMSGPFPAQ